MCIRDSFGTMQSMAQKNMEAWGQMQKTFLDMVTPRTGGSTGAGASGHEDAPRHDAPRPGDDPAKG